MRTLMWWPIFPHPAFDAADDDEESPEEVVGRDGYIYPSIFGLMEHGVDFERLEDDPRFDGYTVLLVIGRYER